MNLAIIFGGISLERKISIMTGNCVMSALIGSHNAYLIEFTGDYETLYSKIKENKTDLIFIALHGGEGEDGSLQYFLEERGIKFTGSNSKASKIAMSKDKTKQICIDNNIETPMWKYFDFNKLNLNQFNYFEIIKTFKNSCVIKPANEGSSIGMTIIDNDLSVEKLKNGLNTCLNISEKIIIEEYIGGRELTVSILGDRTLPIIEIFPTNQYYDYNSKYIKGQCQYNVPAKLSDTIMEKIIKQSLKLHKVIGCRHYSRVDFRLDNKGNSNVLEINTLPGLTDTSLFPKSAKNIGMLYPELINKIIELAIN